MPNLTARDMLARLPVRMAEGGQARAFSDDEVKQFIQSTYAQFGGPGVEAHKAIADAMAQYGVGVNQVARATGYTPREVEAEFMGQRAGERPVLDDPTGTAAGMSAAYRAAAQAGGQQTVEDYYANLRKDAEAYLANPNAPTGVDAYNQLIQSGISTSDLRAAGVADAVLDKIFTVSGPIEQSQFVTPAGMTSAYERSPDLAFESQRLTALGQDGRGILDAQGRDYIANLQQGGIDAAERAQMLEYATERGYSFDDLLKAGVDPNVLFTQRAPVTGGGGGGGGGGTDTVTGGGGTDTVTGGGTDTVTGGAVDDGSAAAAEAERQRLAALAAAEAERQRLAALAAAEAERLRLAGIAAAEKAAADAAAKAAADKAAAEQKRLMDIRIAEEAERVRQAAAKAAADKAAADAAAKAAADAAVVAPGVTTGDIVKAVTPTGPTAAELQAAIDAANAKAAQDAANAKALREAQEAAERAQIAATTGAAVAAVTPSYSAQQLQDIIKAAESQPAAAGTVANPIDTRGSAATGSQSGVSKFLETYTPAAPFVAPAYTPPTVYQPLPAQPDIFAAGQPALDTTFNQSPRTAILDDKGRPTGQFDYSPAAKLRPATGSGFTFTPPSITTRPRSLLSPREIQAYGGTMSASQRFAQNRALIDRNLRDMLASAPALRNASTYNLLRNRVMAGEFGADPARVFNPETAEGQRFQAFLASLAGTAPAQAAATGAATGTVADSVIDIDPTDRQIAAGGGTTSGTTVAGGYAAPIDAQPLMYGGYRLEEFSKGGAVKKSKGSAKDELARFQEGGAVSARRPLNPNDPLYIQEDTPPPAEEQVPLDELLRRQLEGIDNTPSAARTDGSQSESRNMLQNIVAGASQIPGTVLDYGRDIVQSESPLAAISEDVRQMGGAMVEGAKQDPVGFIAGMTPIVGEILSGMDAKKYSDMANEAEAAGDTALADTYRQVAATAAAGAVPLLGTGARAANRMTGSAMTQMLPQRPDSTERTYQLRPTELNPFVGRLDRFIGTELQGTTTLPALVSRLQGKFRDHDIQRVKQIAQGVDPNAKFKPNEILDMLRVNYDPSAFQVQQRTVSPGEAFYTQDDPFVGEPDFALERSVIMLNRDNMPQSAVSSEAAELAKQASEKLKVMAQIGDSSEGDLSNLLRGNTMDRYTAPLVDFLSRNRGADFDNEVMPIIANLEREVREFQDAEGLINTFINDFSPQNFFRSPSFSSALRESKRRQEAEGGVDPTQILRRAEQEAFKSTYEGLMRSYLADYRGGFFFRNLPSRMSLERDSDVLSILTEGVIPEARRNIEQESQALQENIRLQFSDIANNRSLVNALQTSSTGTIPGSNPLYRGNHPSLTPGVSNLISLTRTTDVKADIPGMGDNVKGIYLHELQSDLVNDIRKAGGPRNLTPEQLQERLAQSEEAVKEMIRQRDLLAEEQARLLQGAATPGSPVPSGLQQRVLGNPQVQAENARLEAEIEAFRERIESQKRIQGSINSRLAGLPPRFGALADEPFVGASQSPRMLQQLMIKAAVKAAMDRGLNFVALTSPEKSRESQLYAMTAQNAKDVIKDLGEGFVLKKLDISSPSGQTAFSTMGIVWDQQDAAGREALNRVYTQGIPFKDGGEVTSSRRMLDNLSREAQDGARVGGSAPAVAGRTGRAARLAAQRAADPQTESRTMLERLGRFTSLDTPQDMGLGETAADIGMGFLPVVGTAQGARDFERARRDEDKLGMLLSAASMIPVAGGVIKLGKTGASAARKAVDELSEIFAENPLNPREMVTSGAGATVYPMGGTLRLSDIRTFDPGKGNASQMLRSILEVADKNEVPVELTAQNYSGKGLTTPQLVDWYKRSGFDVVEDLGEDGVDMIRQPRGVTGEPSGAARQGLEGTTPTPAVPTETPEFKNWFGDSAITTTLEPNGKPRRLYHITPKNFDAFDTNRPDATDPLGAGSGPVIFMTDNAEDQLAGHQVGGYGGKYKEGANVMPLYASIKNPLFISDKSMNADRARLSLSKGWPFLYTKKDVSKLKEAGYDGVFGVYDDIPNEIVAFSPEQVKSAIGNVGTYDPSTPVITKAKGGAVTKKAKSNVERVRNDNRRYL